MSRRQLRELMEEFPASIQERVLDYALRVEEAALDIFENVGRRQLAQSEVDDLVFLAGIRKLWAMIDFQYRTFQAVVTAEEYGLAGLRAGPSIYARGSPDLVAVSLLREDLRRTLMDFGIFQVIQVRNLSDLARRVIE